MSNYVFLYKEQNTEDRDCVKYVDLGREIFECDHYFRKIMVTGACFSGGENFDDLDFENITSILTKDEFLQLDKFNKDLRELGYGIKKGDERYQKGIKLYNSIKPIIDKLQSEENQQLFEQVQQEEKEYLMKEYSLDEEDVEFIFDNYNLDYKDRGIVGYIFSDIDEAAQEEAEQLGYVTKENERYFSYEKFGKDLLDGENYVEMPDGRIIRYMY